MPFQMPPRLHNDHGSMRRVGVELEFAGLAPASTAQIVREIFGGEVRCENEFSYFVTGTEFGKFSVLLDAALLKEKKYEDYLAKAGIGLKPETAHTLAEYLLKAASFMVPSEVSTPPIPLDRLDSVELLRAALHQRQARGSRAALRYAFGLHFNPEAPDLALATILAYLRSFLVLHPWLQRRSEIDLSRRLSPYINDFPRPYTRLVLAEDYLPARLIDDFLQYNPTRNRPLDLLPLFALIDREKVMAAEVERDLIKPRPALHYRLPNCLIDDPDWRIAGEWNNWVAVERLAADPLRLRQLSKAFLARPEGEEGAWGEEVEKWL